VAHTRSRDNSVPQAGEVGSGQLYGLAATLECTGFACFRQPTSTSTILTYPVPPFTTLLGLVACAQGLPSDRIDPHGHDQLASQFRIGITPLRIGLRNRELASILKLKPFLTETKESISRFGKEHGELVKRHADLYSLPAIAQFHHLIERLGGIPWTTWSRSPSSPIFREFLVYPSYRVYFVAQRDEIEELKRALEDPQRPLYLGQSDDMVDIRIDGFQPVKKQVTRIFHSIVPGVHPGCEVVRLPLRFTDQRSSLTYATVSIPAYFPFKVEKPTAGYEFHLNGESITVAVFPQ